MKVIVKKIRLNSFLQASGDSKIKNMKYYPGAKTMIMAPLDSRNGEFPLTGLSEDDEARLEQKLGHPKGTLSKSSRFWASYSVTIPEDGLELDTSEPLNELQYKILCQSTLVAKSLEELNTNPDADFVMTNDDQEADVKNRRRDAKKKAYAKLAGMSHEEYREYLIAKGTPGIDTLSAKRIQDMVETDAEDSPKKFLEFINDAQYKDKIFVANLVNAGIVKLQGTRYFDYASSQTLGANLQQMIDYINNPKNQNVLLTLSTQLEHKTGAVKEVSSKASKKTKEE